MDANTTSGELFAECRRLTAAVKRLDDDKRVLTAERDNWADKFEKAANQSNEARKAQEIAFRMVHDLTKEREELRGKLDAAEKHLQIKSQIYEPAASSEPTRGKPDSLRAEHVCACFEVEMIPERVANMVEGLVEHAEEAVALLAEKCPERAAFHKVAAEVRRSLPTYEDRRMTKLEAELEVELSRSKMYREQRNNAMSAADKERRCHSEDMLKLTTAIQWIKMVCAALKAGPLQKAALGFVDEVSEKEIPF